VFFDRKALKEKLKGVVLSVINEDNSISIEEKIEILREKLVAESPDHIKEHIRSQHQQFRSDAKRLFSISGGHTSHKENTPLQIKLGHQGAGREPVEARDDVVVAAPVVEDERDLLTEDQRPRISLGKTVGRYQSSRSPGRPGPVSAYSDSPSSNDGYVGDEDAGAKHKGGHGDRHEEVLGRRPEADITLARIRGNLGAFPEIQVVENVNKQPSLDSKTAQKENDIKLASIEGPLGAFPKIQIVHSGEEYQQSTEKIQRFQSEVTKKSGKPKKNFFGKKGNNSKYKPSPSIIRNSSPESSGRLSAFGFSKFQVNPKNLEIARFDYDSSGSLVLVNAKGDNIARAPQGSNIPIKEHLPKPSPSYSITPVYIKNTVTNRNLGVQRRLQDQFNHLQETGSRTRTRG